MKKNKICELTGKTELDFLLHFSEEAVFQHLEDFLIETDTILQQQNKTHELELCLMLIQCIEVNIYGMILGACNCLLNYYIFHEGYLQI